MDKLYLPTDRGVDVFLEEPPMQPKSAVIAAVENLGLCAVPLRFDDLDSMYDALNTYFVVDGVARSESPSEYAGASGMFQSAMSVAHYFERLDDYYYDPETWIKIWTGIDALNVRNQFNEYDEYVQLHYGEDSLGTGSISYWEKIHGKHISIFRDKAREGVFHLLGNKFYLMHDTTTDELVHHDDRKAPDAGDVSRITEAFEIVEQSGLFDPSAIYIGEFVLSDFGEVVLVQMHHTRTHKQTVADRINPSDFKGWNLAEFVNGRTNGIETTEISTINTRDQAREVVAAGGRSDISITHTNLGSNGRNVLSLYAGTSVLRTSSSFFFSDTGGHGGVSMLTKPSRLAIIPDSRENSKFVEDHEQQLRQNGGRYLLDVVSDGYTAFYRRTIM